MNDYLLIIDGSSLLTTQFYGNIPREILFAKTLEEKEKYFHKIMMTSQGVYTNAVYGFLRTLFQILKDQKPTHLAVTWDITRETFRKKLYPAYKGTRDETLDPLKQQFSLCQKVLERIGVAEFMSEEYEADDYSGSLAKKFEDKLPVRILTKDRDYLQLVTENTNLWMMFSSKEKADELYRKYKIERDGSVFASAFLLTPELVEKEFEVLPCHVNSLKGLEGDSSDNISGVPGIGHITAVKLIKEYGTVDNLYRVLENLSPEREQELKQFWKSGLGITRSPIPYLLKTSDTELVGEKAARLSEQLATIRTDIDLSDLTLKDLRVRIEKDKVEEVLKELEIHTLSADFAETKSAVDISGKIHIVRTEDELNDLVGKAKGEKFITVSYENQKGFAMGLPSGDVFWILFHRNLTEETVCQMIRVLPIHSVTLYCPDGKEFYKRWQLKTKDLTIAAYLLNPADGIHAFENRIAELFPEILNGTVKPELKEIWTFVKKTYQMALSAESLIQKLEEKSLLLLYENTELPMMEVLASMELKGIRIERNSLLSMSEWLTEKMEELEDSIFEKAGTIFNIQSPKQLANVLFTEMQIPYPKKTKNYSTSADILEKLAKDYPIVKDVLEYRGYAKLKSTYTDGLEPYIDEDDRIYSEFNQTQTATGRLSSSNPNLQNIPIRTEVGSRLRKMFVPKEGYTFIDADYSQIELRILAHLSGDESLTEAYRNGEDIHRLTAAKVHHIPIEKVTDAERSSAKAINFGIVYGISAYSLSEDLSISVEEANRYIREYFESFPGIKRFLNQTVENAYENGYTTTLFGRIRPIPELKSLNTLQRKSGERMAMNAPIQGTAADIMKMAMVQVQRMLKENFYDADIVLQVHDEILIECREDLVPEVMTKVKEIMENTVTLSVPLTVSIASGKSWLDCH